jgi:hypothetical protein
VFFGVVGEYIEQMTPNDLVTLGEGGIQVGIAGGDDAEVGRQYEVKPGRRFQYRAEIGGGWNAHDQVPVCRTTKK